MVSPSVVSMLLDRFEDCMTRKSRAPPPETSAAVAIAIVQGFREFGLFSEAEAHRLAAHGTAVAGGVSSGVSRMDPEHDAIPSHSTPIPGADMPYFLRKRVSREMDLLVSVEMYLAQGRAAGARSLSANTGIALLEAVQESPIDLPKLRSVLVGLVPQWAPRLSHPSLGKAALALAMLGDGSTWPGERAASPAAKPR